MRFTEVQAALAITEEEVRELYDAFRAEAGPEAHDVAFLTWLHGQGAITEAMLADLKGALGPPPEPAAAAEPEPAPLPDLADEPTNAVAPETPEPPAEKTPAPAANYDDDDDSDSAVAPHNVSRFVPFNDVQAKVDQDTAAESTAASNAKPAPPATSMMPPPPPSVRTVEPAPARDTGPRKPGTGPQKPATGPQKVAASPTPRTGPQKVAPAASRPSVPQKASSGPQKPATGPQKPGTGPQKPGTGPQSRRKATIPEGARAPEGSTVSNGTPDDIPGRGYRFVGKIGEGAMGQILISKDLDLHRSVAYKVMSPDIKENKELSGKFYTEAQITAQLDHPNVVPLYALARHPDGGLSYTMKQIRGRTFEKVIEETKEQYKARKVDTDHAIETRLDMFLKVLDAMYYAHTRGVVHRDLKPENIMVGAFGEVYVMDWGIARLFDVPNAKKDDLVLVEGYQDWEGPAPEDDDEEDDEIEGVIIGTPQYMSPEQAYGRRDLDGKSDQYALGLILYELVSLRQAVSGKSPQKIVLRQQDGFKEPLVHLFSEAIAPELRGIIEKATQKKIEARYADVRAMGEDIRRYLRGEAVLARPDSARQAISRWVGKHRELTLASVFFLLMMTAFTVFLSVVVGVYWSYAAQAREQSLTQLLTQASAQASRIDSEFARYEGTLGIVAASTAEMLIRGEPTNDSLYYYGDFAEGAAGPPDLRDSKRYGTPISVQYPVLHAKGAKDHTVADDVQGAFQRLTPATRYLRRAMLLSKSEEVASSTLKRAENLISEGKTPISYVTIGLSDGGFIGFPGRPGLPDNFDVKKQSWYKLAEGRREALWGAPYMDSALGPILPCAVSLYDDQDKPKFLGVASVHLPFDYIIENLLVSEKFPLPDGAESFLVDNEGNIVVSSADLGKRGGGGRQMRIREFPVPAVVEKVRALDDGGRLDGDNNDLILYNRMNSLGWYYVVQGRESILLNR